MTDKLLPAARLAAAGFVLIVAGFVVAHFWQPDIPEYFQPATIIQYMWWYALVTVICIAPGLIMVLIAIQWWVRVYFEQRAIYTRAQAD